MDNLNSVEWPKARDIGRIGDMSPRAHLRVGLDADNDVYVEVRDERGGASVEFCNGGGGGGQSMRTRMALIALMVAIEADNVEKPSRDWWAVRRGQTSVGIAEDAAQEGLAPSELSAQIDGPSVPKNLIQAVAAYGDSRADVDGQSAERLAQLIASMRLWAKALHIQSGADIRQRMEC